MFQYCVCCRPCMGFTTVLGLPLESRCFYCKQSLYTCSWNSQKISAWLLGKEQGHTCLGLKHDVLLFLTLLFEKMSILWEFDCWSSFWEALNQTSEWSAPLSSYFIYFILPPHVSSVPQDRTSSAIRLCATNELVIL